MLNKQLLTIFLVSVSSLTFAQKVANDTSSIHLKNNPILFSAKLIDFADNHLHIRYRSGGTKPTGFDCSGFVRFCFGNFGVNLPHSSASQGTLGMDIPKAAALPGDLIFFKGHSSSGNRIGHVGIITEVKGELIKFIHSAWGGGIRYDLASEAYYQKRFMGVKRIIGMTELLGLAKAETEVARRIYRKIRKRRRY
jgi:cell wall-associated NlpC family hydrolase